MMRSRSQSPFTSRGMIRSPPLWATTLKELRPTRVVRSRSIRYWKPFGPQPSALAMARSGRPSPSRSAIAQPWSQKEGMRGSCTAERIGASEAQQAASNAPSAHSNRMGQRTIKGQRVAEQGLCPNSEVSIDLRRNRLRIVPKEVAPRAFSSHALAPRPLSLPVKNVGFARQAVKTGGSATTRRSRKPSVARPSWPCLRAGCPCHRARNLRGATTSHKLVLQLDVVAASLSRQMAA
jgi:hypothetical protein